MGSILLEVLLAQGKLPEAILDAISGLSQRTISAKAKGFQLSRDHLEPD